MNSFENDPEQKNAEPNAMDGLGLQKYSKKLPVQATCHKLGDMRSQFDDKSWAIYCVSC